MQTRLVVLKLKNDFSIFSWRRSVEHRKYILFFLWNYYSKFLNPWNMLVSKMFIGFYFNALKYAILNFLTIWRENKNYLYIGIFCAAQDQESPINLQRRIKNGILLSKLFWPTVRRNCSSVREKLLKFEFRPRICKIFEITIHSNIKRSEPFLVTECFFTLFLEISQI